GASGWGGRWRRPRSPGRARPDTGGCGWTPFPPWPPPAGSTGRSASGRSGPTPATRSPAPPSGSSSSSRSDRPGRLARGRRRTRLPPLGEGSGAPGFAPLPELLPPVARPLAGLLGRLLHPGAGGRGSVAEQEVADRGAQQEAEAPAAALPAGPLAERVLHPVPHLVPRVLQAFLQPLLQRLDPVLQALYRAGAVLAQAPGPAADLVAQVAPALPKPAPGPAPGFLQVLPARRPTLGEAGQALAEPLPRPGAGVRRGEHADGHPGRDRRQEPSEAQAGPPGARGLLGLLDARLVFPHRPSHRRPRGRRAARLCWSTHTNAGRGGGKGGKPSAMSRQ